VPTSPVPDPVPAETVAQPEAVAEPVVAPTPKPERKPAPPPVQEPSMLERLQDYWWALLGLLVAGLGIAALLRRRRRSAPVDDGLEEALGRRPAEDLRARTPVAARSSESDILVEERQPAEPAVASIGKAVAAGTASAFEPSRRPATVEDTLSGDGAVNIEAGDPLAEADFHMAYGLYDQAAELVQVAAKREPQRRDLKLKLIEIFFVWGNRDRFLEIARDLHATRARAEPGEWDKILIMGRQLAPDEPLFAGGDATVSRDLDLELFSGAAATDFELPEGEGPPPDLDLTVLSPEVHGDDSLDFLLDEPVRGGDGGDSEFAPTVRTRGVKDDSALAPTIETPRIKQDSVLEPTVQTARVMGSADEPTAEVPIEDLGLDTTALDGLEDITQLEEVLRLPGAAVEDTVQEQTLAGAGELSGTDEGDMLSSTSMLKVDLDELAAKVASEDRTVLVDLSEATGELHAIDLEAVEATGEIERIESKVGGDITMSEVGTKLDLARAYVDMGDPEGARSILEEVLKEGSPAHRQEAERLMSVLP
jgi:pilus assembly protein FimV